MLIAHTSDFHLFAQRPQTSLVRPDVAEATRRVVADIAGFSPRFDAVFVTGDLADGGSPDDYALVREILSPIEVPVFAVPGNHDARAGFRAAFEDRLPFRPGPKLDYEADCGDLRILGLDTLIEGEVHGGLDDGQIDWLAGRLAEVTDRLTLILMHHPAFPSMIAALDQMALKVGQSGFSRLVAEYPGPLRILSGHIHRPFQTQWNGIWCAVSGGPAFQHALDMTDAALDPSIAEEPFAYFIHRIQEAATVTVHPRYVAL